MVEDNRTAVEAELLVWASRSGRAEAAYQVSTRNTFSLLKVLQIARQGRAIMVCR
jgi:hypothetical protein